MDQAEIAQIQDRIGQYGRYRLKNGWVIAVVCEDVRITAWNRVDYQIVPRYGLPTNKPVWVRANLTWTEVEEVA